MQKQYSENLFIALYIEVKHKSPINVKKIPLDKINGTKNDLQLIPVLLLIRDSYMS